MTLKLRARRRTFVEVIELILLKLLDYMFG